MALAQVRSGQRLAEEKHTAACDKAKSVSLTMVTGAPKTERIVELNGRGYEQRNKAVVVKSDVTPNWP